MYSSYRQPSDFFYFFHLTVKSDNFDKLFFLLWLVDHKNIFFHLMGFIVVIWLEI